MIGTMYCPPQVRSGLSVDEIPLEKNMQPDTKRSPRIFAYDVKTSASSMSPNFPSCASAIPPILMRFRVDKKRDRPVCDMRGKGVMKKIAKRKR